MEICARVILLQADTTFFGAGKYTVMIIHIHLHSPIEMIFSIESLWRATAFSVITAIFNFRVCNLLCQALAYVTIASVDTISVCVHTVRNFTSAQIQFTDLLLVKLRTSFCVSPFHRYWRIRLNQKRLLLHQKPLWFSSTNDLRALPVQNSIQEQETQHKESKTGQWRCHQQYF